MANTITLQSKEGLHPVDENLRPIKVGGKDTAISVAQHGEGAKIIGNLHVTGTVTGSIVEIDNILEIDKIDSTVIDFVATSLGNGYISFLPNGCSINLYNPLDIADSCHILTQTDGKTTISTVDGGGEEADLTFNIDGYIDLNSASGEKIILDSGDEIELDAGSIAEGAGVQFLLNGTLAGDVTGHHSATNIRLYENIGASTDDYFNIAVGASGSTIIKTTDAAGADGHIIFQVDGHVEFDDCAVGFDKLAGTFSTSGVIGDGGDSTDIDFRLSNKYELELTANMSATDKLNFIFPATSGNFLLVISQDGTGSRTVHADSWVAYQSDGSTKATNAAFANGTDGDIRFSGGSAPTLTTTADRQDIVSIYWDADNQTAFAVASLAFA